MSFYWWIGFKLGLSICYSVPISSCFPEPSWYPSFFKIFPECSKEECTVQILTWNSNWMCLLWHASGTHLSLQPLWHSSILLCRTKGSYAQLPTEAVLEFTIQNLGAQRKKNIHPSVYSNIFRMIIHKVKGSESEFAQSCLTLCQPIDCSLQVSHSMGFSRQEYRTGLPFPSPGDLPNPGIEPGSPALQADALSWATREARSFTSCIRILPAVDLPAHTG